MMKSQILLTIGGVYTLGFAVFHLSFWRIFRWKRELGVLRPVNRAIMQVLNLCLTLCFFFFAYLSLAHTASLLGTRLGMELVLFMGLFWLFRAVLQPCFFTAGHPASIGMTVLFLLGSSLYVLSWYLG